MTTPSVRTARPPGQGELVPDDQNLRGEWHADGVAFELWVHQNEGFILADPLRRFEVSGVVAICGQQMSVTWRGAITARPQTWLNAQRARAEREYFGGPDE